MTTCDARLPSGAILRDDHPPDRACSMASGASSEPDRLLSAEPAGTADACARPRGPIVIRPSPGWRWIDLGELWEFRELVALLAWRDVRVRYKQTALGAAWALLQPLAMMVVFTVVFHRMADVSSGGLPYPLFAFAGLLPWTFFATAMTAAGNSVIGSERLITKVYFPRLAIPFAAVGAATVDFAVSLGLLIALMSYYGVMPGVGLVLAPLIFGIIGLTALGLGTFLAALNVSFRDVRYVIPFVVQIGLFATPTIYMQPEGGDGGLQSLLLLNPMATLITAFRAALLGGPMPWTGLGLASAFAVLIFLGGCLYFRRTEDAFADII